MLASDGRALHFDGDSAALVRAVLGACVTARTLDALFEEIERLAGAPVDRDGPVGEVVTLLRGAGALVDGQHPAIASSSAITTGRRVVLAITGGVAAAFAPVVVETFLARGHHVRCIASKNALRFVSKTAIEALTHERVLTSMWSDDPAAPVNHLEIARWAEIVVVHPATATSIGRIANGDCSKLVSAVAISTRAPVLVVPAMNEAMLSAPAIARNVERLVEDGFHVVHAGLGHEVADAPQARRPMVGAPPPPDAVAAIAGAILDEHPRPAPSAVQWDQAYATPNPDALPWATRALEPDVAAILDALAAPGARLLDVGTGTGTGAIEAARRGFSVVATDVAPRAVRLANARATGKVITFLIDDITRTRLATPFDVVLDRGCLHVLDEAGRKAYAAAMLSLVVPGGALVVKVHADAEPIDRGTHRFARDELVALFEGFTPERVDDATLTGPAGDSRALLAVLRRAR